MNSPIGVMQGRLLPKYLGRYQAHPVDCWQQEFLIAKDNGIDCIEFILDHNDHETNPLMSVEGCDEILSLSSGAGVKVLSVCADYFMEAPLHSSDEEITRCSVDVLKRLIESAKAIGVKDLVIPCVDSSSLAEERARAKFSEVIMDIIPLASAASVNLALETDLGPKDFSGLLNRLSAPCITVNYDIGNSASLGFNVLDELSAYGERISDVHIKDRDLGGGSVRLGTGDANIPAFFELFDKFDYQGAYIMQAYRDDEGVTIFQEQFNWLKNHVGMFS